MIRKSLLVSLAVLLLASLFGVFPSPPPETKSTDTQPSAASAPAPAADHQVTVYYFHGHRRCRTCNLIEQSTEETLRFRFAADLKAKRLEWRVVDFEDRENEHFIEDFQLVASSVVLVETNAGKTIRFKVLEKTWNLVHDNSSFEAYIREEVAAFLKPLRG